MPWQSTTSSPPIAMSLWERRKTKSLGHATRGCTATALGNQPMKPVFFNAFKSLKPYF